MENKSGRRISLNFFDILIIIIVIALTAGLIYVKTRGGSEGQASDAAMVTYEIESQEMWLRIPRISFMPAIVSSTK